MNRAQMEEGIRLFLEGVGERFPGDDLDSSPARVARDCTHGVASPAK